ncbi:outer envelope pore protein 24B, chloroplastic-like [Zingiber officinale]|uniref:outer envelope pore protein 24B, chloroplastic-like n=1 Tax=Zingiber officinale TaxID=94328 RepID=UPI001C4CE4FB|nr:outer envelope pore protein 24B, chloroplastic-like [Zingiber officinale]
MLEASFTGKYETDAKAGKGSTTLSVGTNVGEAKLKALATIALEAADYSPPSFAFSLSKPDSFSIRYSPEKKDGDPPNLRFKFMNSMNVMGGRVNMAYHHAVQERKTKVKSLVEFNDEHKMAVKHLVGTKDCELRYKFAPRRFTVVEPSYKLASREWAVALSRSFESGDVLKGSFDVKDRKVGLEWSRTSKERGTFKISGSLVKKDNEIKPQLMAQTTWSCSL